MVNPVLYKKLYLVLQEIAYAVVTMESVTSIANFLLEVGINYTDAESGSLMLLNDRDELYVLTARGLPPRYAKTYRTKLGHGVAGIVARNGYPMLVRDIEAHPEFRTCRHDHYKTKSFVSCPIVFKSKLLGVMNINDKKDGTPFTDDEFDLLQVIANHAAIALERASLTDQLKSTAAELEQANKRLIETDLLKTEFLNRLSHELRTPLNSLRGAIYYLRGQDAVPEEDRKEFHGIIAAETDRLSSLVENLLHFLRVEDESRIVTKTVVHLHTVLRKLSSAASLKATLKNAGIHLHVRVDAPCSPIAADKMKTVQFFTSLIEGLAHHLVRGDFISVNLREEDFVNVDIALSRSLPQGILPYLHDAASIFHSTPSEDRLKLYLARNIADIHHWGLSAENDGASCRITLTIPHSAKETVDAQLKKSMDTFVDHIAAAMDLDICSVMLTDELTGELTVKSAHGLEEGIVKRTRIKPGDKIAGWVAVEGKPLLIDDIENDPRFAKKSIDQYYTKSLMSLPLKVDGRVVGVINLNNKRTSEPFSKRDFDVALAVSDRLAEFLKRIHADRYREDDFKQVLSSLDTLVKESSKGRNSSRSKR